VSIWTGDGSVNTSDERRALILIVEDIDWIRSGMKHTAERYGYQVAEAADVAEAVKVAERRAPDLILTEEELPALIALIARVQAHPTLQYIPVVIVNPDADERTHYGDAVVLTDYEHLAGLLLRPEQRPDNV
jgi:CheY-like chemotaxis protein